MKKENKKVICPNCGRTDYYKVKPNYCAFCGVNLQKNLENHNKSTLNHK